MGVNIRQDDDGYMGLVGTDADDGPFVFATAEYTASSIDKSFYIATRAVRVVAVTLRVTAAGTDAGAVTAMIEKVPSGTAIGSGTDILSATVNLKGTANTNAAGALSTTAGALDLAAGNSLGLDLTGTMTAATGSIVVAMCLK
jgi:hypothetical protein